MGPIMDQLGVEQGGPNSSEHYKTYNNEQLTTAQNSGFGANILGVPVAAIGQADDTALLSNDLHQLQCLLDLSISYCEKHQVQLSTSKTKLLVFTKKNTDYVKYSRLLSPLHIGKDVIPFSSTAEHVGVLRSTGGNLPHILNRISSHKRALGQILRMGMSRQHRANPIAVLRAETVFTTPVLMSGVASLLLSKTEADTLFLHIKETTESLLKLHRKTPAPVVFFLAGRLPGEAQLHLKQLTIFGMICRLPGNVLNTVAHHLLTYTSSRNWFSDIKSICYTYHLPHPLTLLKEPPNKDIWKNICKAHVTDFWQNKLREQSKQLKSLEFFKPQFMSLCKPHPMWSFATTSYKVNKCVTVSRMLSGRFHCGNLLRHMYPSVSGVCELCGKECEDLLHIVLPRCPFLKARAENLLEYARATLLQSKTATDIFFNTFKSKDDKAIVQMLLDPSVVPEIIAATQKEAQVLQLIMSVTTTWCYTLNRARIKLLGK